MFLKHNFIIFQSFSIQVQYTGAVFAQLETAARGHYEYGHRLNRLALKGL